MAVSYTHLDTRRTDIIDRVRHACMTDGRQAYWVCTLIDESDLLEAQAAMNYGKINWLVHTALAVLYNTVKLDVHTVTPFTHRGKARYMPR